MKSSIERSRCWRVLVRVLAVAALVACGKAMMPVTAHAVPGSITFPVNATKSVIQSQSPLRWCFASQANCHHDYNAADIFAPTGTPVVSPVGGSVIRATTASSGVGSRVQIRDDQGNIWYLAHMHHSPGLRVSQGQRVERGTPIGFVGTSAHAVGTQPHLHVDMLPPPYTSRPSCSGSACTAYPFYNLQPLLVAAFNGSTVAPKPEVAFQANTGSLWTVGWRGNKNWSLGMRDGTSPSVCALPGNGYEVAFQANTSSLWTVGNAGNHNWSLGMKAGTSPAITCLPSGGYEVAFQANTSSLWTVGNAGNHNWSLGMKDRTSPSVCALAGGGYEVAFQANTGSLWTVGKAGNKNWSLGMKAGTSPAITCLPGGGYEVAFQANTGSLWTVGNAGNHNWSLGMKDRTSPSVCALAGGGYEVAFQANTGSLWTVGKAGNKNWSLGMKAGTSPAITCLPGGGYEATFQANTGSLWTVGNVGNKNWSLGMKAGTSPAISS